MKKSDIIELSKVSALVLVTQGGASNHTRMDTVYNYTSKDLKRFWSKVKTTDNPNDCWEWQGTTQNKGYGMISIGGRNGKQHLTHRVSWELANGEIPDGLGVCHKCDNPLCVNPNHLFLGTHLDNMRDMFSKGRRKANPPKGDKHNMAKITQVKANEIRQRYENGGISQRALGVEYGLNQAVIWRIIHRKLWNYDHE